MFPDRKPMLLVKKRNFFHFFFFLLKITVEIILNNFVEKSEKSDLIWCNFFPWFLFGPKRTRNNDVLDRKETFFDYQNKIF